MEKKLRGRERQGKETEIITKKFALIIEVVSAPLGCGEGKGTFTVFWNIFLLRDSDFSPRIYATLKEEKKRKRTQRFYSKFFLLFFLAKLTSNKSQEILIASSKKLWFLIFLCKIT